MSAASLKEVFDQFAVYGKSAKQKAASKGEMDGRTLVKLAKQAKLTNKKVTQTDLDIWFSGTKTKGKKTITFEQFKKILDAIAKKSGVSAKDIHNKVMKSGGPGSGKVTKADNVRFHDDKSTYTGVHTKGGPDTKGNSRIRTEQLLDRSKADIRGRKIKK